MDAPILVVDDDPAIRMLVERVLTRAGYAVTSVEGGFAAESAVAETTPCLVITDLQMPRGDGRQLIAHLKRDHPTVPIMVMTGISEYADLSDIPLLTKPFPIARLLELVQRLAN